jgi:hypothetical protein
VGSTTPPGPYAVPWIVNCQQAHFSRSCTTCTVENKFTNAMKIHCGILEDDTLQIGREVAILNKWASSLQRDEWYVFTTPHSITSHKKHDLSIHCN